MGAPRLIKAVLTQNGRGRDLGPAVGTVCSTCKMRETTPQVFPFFGGITLNY